MGVVISKPAINIREQLTELKAQQGYEERQFHFDNLVTNGTFDTDTDWTKGTGWTISGGVASFSNPTGTELYQSLSLPAGVYAVTVTASYTGTAPAVYFNSPGITNTVSLNNGTPTTAILVHNGSYSRVTVLGTGASTVTLDNISVYTSDGTDVAFTMPKGWKPLHVYDDGVLQREGSAEDYEVTFDGFNYYVKPTVANPGARNTVIGVRA